ncbi:MAG TPA: metallophosphoesterase family protein [Thermoflexia bacterium]|nr:metallophosphoesterase family protein [Thermoflexia bacterium]
MRYLILSDIHGNNPALQSVLRDAGEFAEIWCLGDIVGYGPNPNQCIDQLREYPLHCSAGNHDWGALGKTDLYVFNRAARQALLWTRDELTARNMQMLNDLPTSLCVQGYLLAHGSPREPVWEYILNTATAQENFQAIDFRVALVGHTHMPAVFEWLPESRNTRLMVPDYEGPLHLDGRRLIINPGSVGQPRDGNPDAAYGILDTEAATFEFRRVPYPVAITQARMSARKLPQRLIDRLEMGR